ncbi:MAG TPA: alkaline phosphatase family protein [Thermomicrobiales bacterium]|nr:alkaline phosphatase family protein [Thermomicrobiales bacterium]
MSPRRSWALGLSLALTLVAGLLSPTLAAAQAPPPFAGADVPAYQHIFVIMMENHSYDEIIGNSDAPEINALAQTYGLATDYYAVTHPSEPNYLASVAGTYFGIQDDAPPTAPGHTHDAPSIVDQLEARGLTWKTYQQALPYAGFTGASSPPGNALYAVKHNPFAFFARVQGDPAELQRMVPDTQLAADLAGGDVPNFAYIAPDQCHDMHGLASCGDDTTLIRQGDAYVAATVARIMAAPVWRRGNTAIVVTWDENDFSTTGVTGCCDANPGGGHVATIVIANHGPRGVRDATPYNHYALLQTVEDAFRLGCLAATCDRAAVRPLAPLFAVGRADRGD